MCLLSPVCIGIFKDAISFNQTFDRKQQITACEALLGVITPFNLKQQLLNQDCVWFMDNKAACSLLVKGNSSHSDLSAIACITHLLLTSRHCRCYFEWVESEANLADGLSRSGLEDAWTKSRLGFAARSTA
jgi:hypothetical protein